MIKSGISVLIGRTVSSSGAFYHHVKFDAAFQGLRGALGVANRAFGTSPRLAWKVPGATREFIESKVLLNQKVTVITGGF